MTARDSGRPALPLLLLVVLAGVHGIPRAATAAPARRPMTYIYNAPESPLDVRYVFHWDILRTALERTKAKWGPYAMERAELMTEQRQAYELEHATGKITVMYLSTTPDFERNLVAIHIPVDRGLGGYFVFLIHESDRERFASVKTLDDLRRFSYGAGLDWIDVGILRANGFKVVTGSSYDGLFEMLVQKRFDVFPRSVTEVFGEYDGRKHKLPGMIIEDHILLHYPLPMYFWFPKTPEGRRLAARAEEGMRMMIDDGTYQSICRKYQRPHIEALHLKERRLFTIRNPNVGPETPMGDKRLWFDLQQAQ